MQTQKGSATIVAFIVLLLTLGVTVWYFKNFPLTSAPAGESIKQPEIGGTKNEATNNPPTQIVPSPPTKATVTQTKPIAQETTIDKWKVFNDSRYTFQFEYPKEWSVENHQGDIQTIVLKDDKNYEIMTIGSANLSLIGISYCGANPQDKRCETIKMKNGGSAVVDWNASGTAYAMIGSPDGLYGVGFTLHKVNSDTKTIFRKILSTFKFVK